MKKYFLVLVISLIIFSWLYSFAFTQTEANKINAFVNMVENLEKKNWKEYRTKAINLFKWLENKYKTSDKNTSSIYKAVYQKLEENEKKNNQTNTGMILRYSITWNNCPINAHLSTTFINVCVCNDWYKLNTSNNSCEIIPISTTPNIITCPSWYKNICGKCTKNEDIPKFPPWGPLCG